MGVDVAERVKVTKKGLGTYSVKMYIDLTASIDSSFFTPELCNFAQDADCAVGELL
jgi:hypothetical protein